MKCGQLRNPRFGVPFVVGIATGITFMLITQNLWGAMQEGYDSELQQYTPALDVDRGPAGSQDKHTLELYAKFKQRGESETSGIRMGTDLEAAPVPDKAVTDGRSTDGVQECTPRMNAEEFQRDKENMEGPGTLDLTMKRWLSKPCGFFIESGANDGTFQSNTYIYEKNFGWKGLLIEPAESLISKIKSSRPGAIVEHAALTSFAKHGEMILMPKGNPMGKAGQAPKPTKVKGGKPVKTMSTHTHVIAVSLSHLLDKHNISYVDFFSLDVEGGEVDVLQGIDWRRHRPRLVLIEVWNRNPETFQAMQDACYTLVTDNVDTEGSLSGWTHHTQHRDFLWEDREEGRNAPACKLF